MFVRCRWKWRCNVLMVMILTLVQSEFVKVEDFVFVLTNKVILNKTGVKTADMVRHSALF
jgi:hypothetical protein